MPRGTARSWQVAPSPCPTHTVSLVCVSLVFKEPCRPRVRLPRPGSSPLPDTSHPRVAAEKVTPLPSPTRSRGWVHLSLLAGAPGRTQHSTCSKASLGKSKEAWGPEPPAVTKTLRIGEPPPQVAPSEFSELTHQPTNHSRMRILKPAPSAQKEKAGREADLSRASSMRLLRKPRTTKRSITGQPCVPDGEPRFR